MNYQGNEMDSVENKGFKQESEAVRILRHAKALISDKEHWIKDEFATNAEGEVVPMYDNSACNFCSVGANRKAAGSGRAEISRPYLAMATAIMTLGAHSHIARFNDFSTHEEVMELFDVAIAWAIGADSVGMGL